MKAGDLREPIRLEKPSYETDSRGNRTMTWTQVGGIVYASMKDVSGKDFYAAQAYQAQDIVTFGIRWRSDIRKTWRIIYHGVAYGIEQINNLGYKRDFMHIKARAIQGEGGNPDENSEEETP